MFQGVTFWSLTPPSFFLLNGFSAKFTASRPVNQVEFFKTIPRIIIKVSAIAEAFCLHSSKSQPPVFPRGTGRFCLREDLAFLTVDLAFHVQLNALGVRRQPPCSGKFAWLGNHPSLANRSGASVEVATARCRYCFSKPVLFSPFEPRSLQ